MNIKELAIGVTTDVTGETVLMDKTKTTKAVASIVITGTATASLQGRLSADTNDAWVELGSYTATTMAEVLLLQQMRVVTSGLSGGSVTVNIGYP